MLNADDLVFSSVPMAHVPLLARLAPVRAAGFAGISLLPGDIWALEEAGMDAPSIVARIADQGLAIAEIDCIGAWLPSQRTAASSSEYAAMLADLTPDRVVTTAARVGARSVTVVEMLGVRPSLDEAAESFAAICDQAAAHGLLVHIEFLPFAGIPDLKSAWNIVEAAGRPNGCLTIDSWHLFRSGSTLDQLASIPGSRIGTVQINDAPAAPGTDLFTETMTARLLPGQGELDVAGVIRTLDRIGSVAPIGVEVLSHAERTEPIGDIARSWFESARSVITRARARALPTGNQSNEEDDRV